MNDLTCGVVQNSFSEYLDGAISGREMQAVALHLGGCEECSDEFAEWREMQSLLGGLGPAKAPEDLGLKLRVAVSQESRKRQNWIDTLTTGWENTVRPMLVQVSAGAVAAVVLVGGVGLLLGMVAAPEPVMANDEPLGAITVPHYIYSSGPTTQITTPEDTTIVVAALVNEKGQIYDYQLLSGPVEDSVRTELMNRLVAEVFEPATVFGLPAKGRVIQTFAGVSVRG